MTHQLVVYTTDAFDALKIILAAGIEMEKAGDFLKEAVSEHVARNCDVTFGDREEPAPVAAAPAIPAPRRIPGPPPPMRRPPAPPAPGPSKADLEDELPPMMERNPRDEIIDMIELAPSISALKAGWEGKAAVLALLAHKDREDVNARYAERYMLLFHPLMELTMHAGRKAAAKGIGPLTVWYQGLNDDQKMVFADSSGGKLGAELRAIADKVAA